MRYAPPGNPTSIAVRAAGGDFSMRGVALALIAAGCAHARAPDAARVVLETAPRATARVGAARLALWIANDGPSPRRVVVDPEALLVAVTSPSGQAVSCRRPSTAEIPTSRLVGISAVEGRR